MRVHVVNDPSASIAFFWIQICIPWLVRLDTDGHMCATYYCMLSYRRRARAKLAGQRAVTEWY